MALIPEDPKQRNAIIIAILIVVGFYFFHSNWYTPRQAEIERMERRLTQLEDQNRRARVIATQGAEGLEQRLAVYERHIVQLERLIPESEEVPALLNEILVEARNTRVEVTGIRPEPVQVGEFYTRESYELTAVGDYHDMGRFLTAIASLPRIITPVDLNISRFTRGPEAESPVVASFRILTYTLPTGRAVVDAADEDGGY